MANTKDNVSVAKPNVSGAVWCAPLGTAVPADATSPLNEAFKSWGYISEDGITETQEREVTEVKAWGGETVKNTTASMTKKYSFTAIETNEQVLKGRYGDANVQSTLGSLTIQHTDADLPRMAWVFEMLLDDGRIDRKVIEDGQVVETGEVAYKSGEVIAYPVVMQAYKSNGAYVNEYIAKAE